MEAGRLAHIGPRGIAVWDLAALVPILAEAGGRLTDLAGVDTHDGGNALANELGLRNVSFEVNDVQAAVDWAASEGYGLVGGIGEYEGAWRMAYVRGPEGIIVSLSERIG